MNGVHDLGGMHGFGPVVREGDEPVFHEAWEGRIFALLSIMGQHPGLFAPGGFRFRLESIDPARYLSSSYYEKWLMVLEQALVEKGIVTADELSARTDHVREHADFTLPRRENPKLVELIRLAALTRYPPHREVGVAPRFATGDRVRARTINPAGHTRLPRYVRGRRGTIDRVHGVHDFQDATPPGTKAQPQPVYCVRFDANELWGESAEPRESVYIDMWESYLEPA